MERSFRRVARYADGWMTNKLSPEEFRRQWSRITAMAREEGRDPAALGSALYHNININEDRTGRSGGEQDLPRYVLHGQLQREVRGGVDRRPAAPISAWTSSARTSTRASRTSRCG